MCLVWYFTVLLAGVAVGSTPSLVGPFRTEEACQFYVHVLKSEREPALRDTIVKPCYRSPILYEDEQ